MLQKQWWFTSRHLFLLFSQLFVIPLFYIATNSFTTRFVFTNRFVELDDVVSFNVTGAPLRIPYSFDPNRKASRDLATHLAGNRGYFVPSATRSLEEHFRELAQNETFDYDRGTLVGFQFGGENDSVPITAFYNNKVVHSPALSLAMIHNAILGYISNGGEYSLRPINHPLNLKDPAGDLVVSPDRYLDRYLMVQDVVFAFSFLMAGFAIPIIKERSGHFKTLQLLSGLSRTVYWFLTFGYNFTLYMLACSIFLLTLYFTEIYGFSVPIQLGRLTVLLIFHGFAGLAFIVLISCFIKSPTIGYLFIFSYHTFCLVLDFVKMLLHGYMFEKLDVVFSALMPCYCLMSGFQDLYVNWKYNRICRLENAPDFYGKERISMFFQKYCCRSDMQRNCLLYQENYFAWKSPGIGKQLCFLLLQSILFVLVTTCTSSKWFQHLERVLSFLFCKRQAPDAHPVTDTFDLTPLPRLLHENYFVVSGLTKYYGSKLVLDRVSFGIHEEKTFGLVGHTEVGKSTLMRIVSGQLLPTAGQVYLDKKKIDRHLGPGKSTIGLCPSVNTNVFHLTGLELLWFFSVLRGIPKKNIAPRIANLCDVLGIEMHLERRIRDYSYSTNRRFSVAIALLGVPPLILLDEPTHRLNPTHCGYVWNAIRSASSLGCTVLLTTDRLSECDAVCSEIGVMLDHRLTYRGDLCRLREKFSVSSTIRIQPSQTRQSDGTKNNAKEILQSLKTVCKDAELKANFPGTLIFRFPNKSVEWPLLFPMLEAAKHRKVLVDYSVNETTLDSVLFIESFEEGETVSTLRLNVKGFF